MDWTSVEGDKLLWEAWPAGYLATRGVLTVGGWTCLDDDSTSTWADPGKTFAMREGCGVLGLGMISRVEVPRLLEAGDLLPLPDPEDVCTWAALIHDLAAATELFTIAAETKTTIIGLTFGAGWEEPCAAMDDLDRRLAILGSAMATLDNERNWILTVFTNSGDEGVFTFALPVTDRNAIDEALVRARIQLREKKK